MTDDKLKLVNVRHYFSHTGQVCLSNYFVKIKFKKRLLKGLFSCFKLPQKEQNQCIDSQEAERCFLNLNQQNDTIGI